MRYVALVIFVFLLSSAATGLVDTEGLLSDSRQAWPNQCGYPPYPDCPPAPMTPSPPQSLQATPGDGQVSLLWLAPVSAGSSAITNYNIYWGTAPNPATLLPVAKVLSHTQTGLTNGQIYYYQVTAVNAVGESGRSNQAFATPAVVVADTLDPIISITSPAPGAELDSTTVAVTGMASDNVGLGKVELSVGGVSWIPAAGTATWSGTLTLDEGQNTIHARAVDTSGNFATATVTVTVTLETGGQSPPDPMILGIIAAIAVGAAAGVVALLLARRRRLRVGESGRQS